MKETLPNVNEALGLAKAMEKSNLPYFVSFVINRNGTILDGTNLIDAIHRIDEHVCFQPLGYFVNCAYPSFLCPSAQPPKLFDRLKGYIGNASSLDHAELENAGKLQQNETSDWGEEMLKLNRQYGVQILGGCCGTGVEYIRYLTGY
jgi:S-methylmethionine-dependent homocysteine/selenocysteine methylase